MSNPILRKKGVSDRRQTSKVEYGVSVPKFKRGRGKVNTSSDVQQITLNGSHLTAAIEEYLHRLKLIGENDTVDVPDPTTFKLSVRKEASHN